MWSSTERQGVVGKSKVRGQGRHSDFGFQIARRQIRNLQSAICIGVVWLVCLAGVAGAVSPIVWREDTQKAFLKGEPEGVSLTRDGVVTLSPVLEEVADTGEQFVWALAEDGKGRLYIATGNSGKVFVLDGRGAPDLLFDSPEVAIFSLTVGSDGALYAGSSPDGLIYRIAPGRDPVTFCHTGDDHVWALVPGVGGGLYAATGRKQGRIVRISPGGEAEPVYQSSDHNVVCLIRGPDGRLYAGTDENGLVYRVDAKGKVEVLYDAAEKEVHALALGTDGVLYAGAMSGSSRVDGGKGAAPPSQQPRPAPEQESSALYAIRPSGAAFRLWEASEPMLLALAIDAGGEVTVVTGDKGSVYRVRSDGAATLLARMADVQPWAFCPSQKGGFWIGGAGKVYRLGKGYAPEGSLTSKPRDFAVVSRWGRAAWKADLPEGTSISFQTRSGNSEVPDDTWSPWSGPIRVAGQVPSPPGRFLQYRVRLGSETDTATPRLREVTLAGLQENVRPQVLSLAVSPPQRKNSASGGGGHSGSGKDGGKGRHPSADAQKGVWKIAWSGGDVNNDRLVYDIYFRGREEKSWKLLEEEIRSTSYVWNIESAPEGTMQVRVVASDRLSNPEPTALSAEKVSEPFDLDHTPPFVRLSAVRQTEPGTVLVEGSVSDAISPIREASYAVNSGPWKVIFPADQIFDSRTESLSFAIEKLMPGEYAVVVRAVDALGNVGVGKAVVEVE